MSPAGTAHTPDPVRPPTDAPDPVGVPARVAAVAAGTPTAVAVRAAAGSLDYAGLLAAAQTVGWALRHLDRAARVGVLLPGSPPLVAGMLGVWWAGHTAVPLDASATRMRLRLQAADAQLAVVLADETTEPVAAGLGVPVLRVDTLPPAPTRVPPPNPHPQAAAVVVHSAGVWKEPRPVVVTHGNLTGLADWLAEDWPAGTLDRARPAGPWDGAVAVGLLAATLAGGGTVCVDDDPLPPTVRFALPDHADAGSADLLVLTGEPPVGPAPAAGCWSAWSAAEVGGPVLAGPYADEDPTALGRPRPDAAVYVLDDDLRPVPPGVAGRLYVGGPAVTGGYLDAPALTAAGFLPDPFADRPGQRMVATDDLVRVDADGVLRRVGRVDECARTGAVVTSPVPALAALRELPGVARAAVVPATSGGFDAAVVPVDGARVDVARLRARLAGLLPAGSLPGRLVVVDALPLLPSGKVNRRAVSAAVVRAARQSRPPSRTAAELAVERAWAEVLPQPVGLDRNFFDAGGDSLSLVRLAAVLRRTFDREVDVVELFRLPTIRAMAAYLSASGAAPVVEPATRPPATTGAPSARTATAGPPAADQPAEAARRQARARQAARRQVGRARGVDPGR